MGSSVFPAAASGPTLSEITTAGSSAGWGATGSPVPTWTLITSLAFNNTNTMTLSGLSGYKELKIVWYGLQAGTGEPTLTYRMNGDTGNNYGGGIQTSYSATSSPVGNTNGNFSSNQNMIGLIGNAGSNGIMRIQGANLTNVNKHAEWKCSGTYAGQTSWHEGVGNWQGTGAAVSSITFLLSSSTFSGGTIYAYGAN